MQVAILTLLLVAAVVLQSCNKSGKEDLHDHGKKKQPVLESVGQGSNVKLDHGMKWVSDSTTNQGMEKIRAITEAFDPKSDVEILKKSLNDEFASMLNKCTMQGEAHNQLHNYLLPLKSRIDGLDSSAQSEAISDLKAYLTGYWNYFK